MTDGATTLRTVESIARMEARIAESTARATAAEARVAELLSDRADAAEVIVTEVERAQTAERRVAELTAALRDHAGECAVASCARFATWSWRVRGVDYHTCDEHRGESSFMEEAECAAVLRSLDGVSR